MMISETELIERFFRGLGAPREDVVLGIGDDAALLRVAPGEELVLTTDALVEGVHFLPGAPADSLGHRALAVNLSDLAAMGASARWALLSLNLPQADGQWLGAFAQGFGATGPGSREQKFRAVPRLDDLARWGECCRESPASAAVAP